MSGDSSQRSCVSRKKRRYSVGEAQSGTVASAKEAAIQSVYSVGENQCMRDITVSDPRSRRYDGIPVWAREFGVPCDPTMPVDLEPLDPASVEVLPALPSATNGSQSLPMDASHIDHVQGCSRHVPSPKSSNEEKVPNHQLGTMVDRTELRLATPSQDVGPVPRLPTCVCHGCSCGFHEQKCEVNTDRPLSG